MMTPIASWSSQLVVASLLCLPLFRIPVLARGDGAEAKRMSLSSSSSLQQQRRGLLVNGVDTPVGKYPWYTQVGCCSGALIAPDVVLSVGHVFPEVTVNMILSVGAHQRFSPNEQSPPPVQLQDASSWGSVNNDTRQDFVIAKTFQHPNYASIHSDFAIFLVHGASTIPPVQLNRNPNLPSPEEPDLILLGTGTSSMQSSERPTALQETTSRYISNEMCASIQDPTRPGISYTGAFLDETNLCTFSENDGCAYDSGGPILLPRSTSSSSSSSTSMQDAPTTSPDILVGLISFGVDCADPVFPAVNARVSAVMDWIDSIVCQYSKHPPADFACNKTLTTGSSTSNKNNNDDNHHHNDNDGNSGGNLVVDLGKSLTSVLASSTATEDLVIGNDDLLPASTLRAARVKTDDLVLHRQKEDNKGWSQKHSPYVMSSLLLFMSVGLILVAGMVHGHGQRRSTDNTTDHGAAPSDSTNPESWHLLSEVRRSIPNQQCQ